MLRNSCPEKRSIFLKSIFALCSFPRMTKAVSKKALGLQAATSSEFVRFVCITFLVCVQRFHGGIFPSFSNCNALLLLIHFIMPSVLFLNDWHPSLLTATSNVKPSFLLNRIAGYE